MDRLTVPELMRRAAMRWDNADEAGAKRDWDRAGELGGWHLCAHRNRLNAIVAAVLEERNAQAKG